MKVITAIRRCGKSSLSKLMVKHLLDSGIAAEQIIEMNFESYDFKKMNADDLYHYVQERILPERRAYMFFDKIQRVPNWEDTVNSFRVDFDCDIYTTDSNAYLLSSEYATYLSVRWVEIKMLPLFFAEFIEFYGFYLKSNKNALGDMKTYARTLGKYYIVDIGLRNYLLGFRARDRGHAIENVVYFELLRRGYDVAMPKWISLLPKQMINYMCR